MDFKHFTTFIVTAEELHVGRASERLGISQPAVTQQIKVLEADLGYRVFHRVRRGIALTEGGAAFLEQARAAVATAEAAVLAGRRASRGESGALNIAYVHSAMLEPELPALLRRASKALPDVELRLRDVAVSEQLAALQDDTIDVAFLRSPPGRVSDAIRIQPFSRTPLDAVLPRGHRCASRRSVSLATLADERFVLVDDPAGVGLGHRARELCRDAGFDPRDVLLASDSISVVALVSAGLGIGLVPRSLSRFALEDAVFRPLTAPNVYSEILVATRTFERSMTTRAFLDVLRKG